MVLCRLGLRSFEVTKCVVWRNCVYRWRNYKAKCIIMREGESYTEPKLLKDSLLLSLQASAGDVLVFALQESLALSIVLSILWSQWNCFQVFVVVVFLWTASFVTQKSNFCLCMHCLGFILICLFLLLLFFPRRNKSKTINAQAKQTVWKKSLPKW